MIFFLGRFYIGAGEINDSFCYQNGEDDKKPLNLWLKNKKLSSTIVNTICNARAVE